MKKPKSKTPADIADHMIERYGSEAGIHCVYNMMQYDRDTAGWQWWIKVANAIRQKLKGGLK